ncbi:hypothetical protein SteCoe_28119 [Stentor coeruleus]|uniref:Uncharacterized protein n=1 Tax=Stentor coeruleus TaxID=5963 RepID=A0A1R2B8Y6_9CILI|nr:hypothetical protein SteCoe_28119 [Stentor coeruleus]
MSSGNLRYCVISETKEFKFLKEQVGKYYIDMKVQRNIMNDKSNNWVKNLHSNVSLLLSEILLTKDLEQQNKLLDKVYIWYMKKMFPKENGTESPNNSSSPQTKFPQVSRTPYQKTYKNIYMPKNNSVSCESSFINTNFILNKKKRALISRAKGSSRRRKFLAEWGNRKNRQEEDFVYRTDLKNYSKTPEPSSSSMDIASNSGWFMVDFRNTKLEKISKQKKINIFSRDSSLINDLNTIENIKRKLATKNIKVSAKCLEQGISLYTDLKVPQIPKVILPSGGELLIKAPNFLSFSKSSKKPKKKT